jgi:ribosomal protein S18 acetylase RimI-like enzyme
MRLRAICESVEDLQQRLERTYDLEQLWITEGPKHVEIHNIRVKPENRNTGVGTQVIDEIKKYAASVGKHVVLFAEPDRGKKAALSRFYKRQGFQKPGRSKDFSLPRHTHIWHPE